MGLAFRMDEYTNAEKPVVIAISFCWVRSILFPMLYHMFLLFLFFQVSFIAMYRKEECQRLFEDQEQCDTYNYCDKTNLAHHDRNLLVVVL